MALDLGLPNDVFFIISQGSFEFKTKNGIVDMLSDQISYSKVSDFTDTSSIMRNVNVNGTEKKKRTLSIAPSKTSDMSPGKIGGDYTIDV